jgi:chromosome segregation ATPase
MPQVLPGLALVALVLLLPATAMSATFYRYTNDQGVTVVDDNVPPEYVKKGYEVVNEKGVVIKVVPRELSPEEQEIADAEKLLEERAKAEQLRLKEWDESLLMRYSTVEDIEAAKERALMDLRIRVSILKSNKRSLKQQVENYQAEAAEQERMGKQVDVARLSKIEDLQSEIATTDRSIADRENEIEAVSAAYDSDIERFTMLQDMVEFRRSVMVGEQDDFQDPRR